MNIAALKAQRQLAKGQDTLSTVFERLSSGQRINRASDDAAGLALSTQLQSDSRVYAQALRNVNDGISVLSIVDGALGTLTEIVTRQIELAQQAANGTYSAVQRKALHDEAKALTSEYNRVVQSVSFNGINLLEDTNTPLHIQAGYGTNGSISFEVGDESARSVGTGEFDVSAVTVGGVNERAMADVNNDGLLDIVSGQSGSPTYHVALGNGDGTFQTSTSYTLGGGNNTNQIALADLDNDGNVDIAIGSTSGDSNIFISYGNGDGTFSGSQAVNIGSNHSDLQFIDVNGDGHLDISAISDDSDHLRVYLGDGTGAFTSSATVSLAGGVLQSDSVYADFDNDGDLDLLVTQNTNGVYLFEANGDGTFQAGTQVTNGTGNHRYVDVGDFNDDGFVDFAHTKLSTDEIVIKFGNGDGTFEDDVGISSGNADPTSITVQDFNGDGIDDFLVGSSTSNYAAVLIGNGDGTFQSATTIEFAGTLHATNGFSVGDLNNDGALDFIANAEAVAFGRSVDVNTQSYLSLHTASDALTSLSALKQDLERLSAERGNIGATQSRLGFAANVLLSTRENYEAAASRILDADIAAETAELTRLQILRDAGAAILAQANLQPQLVLDLLNDTS